MEKLNLDKKSLRKFGVTMAIAFSIITLLILWKHRHSIVSTSIISFAFLFFAIAAPGILRWAYIVWMRFAFILGWINTRIILVAMFYLVLTPIGIVMKLFGVDLLQRKRDNRATYWLKREDSPFNAADYQRQF